MNLKTTNRIAIEKAVQQLKGKKLVLLGTPDGVSSDTPKFLESFGTDHKFFYVAEQFIDGVPNLRERGVGTIELLDGQPVLVRSNPFAYYIVREDKTVPSVNGPIDLQGDVIVSSSYPFSLVESLCCDYSVPACDYKHIPKNVSLAQYSFLGRLDGDVVSVPAEEFVDHSVIVEALTRAVTGYSKQMTFSATKLNMKSKRGVISSNIFHLNPTTNPPAKKGTLIYDEASDNLKYYDGASWRTIKYELDQ